MTHVLVIGAGLMGSQIGCELALAGSEVAFFARDPEAARARVEAAFALAVRAGICSAETAAEVAMRIRFTSSVAAGAEGCDAILESVAEQLELKSRLLRAAAAAAPTALVATNTSSLRITDVGAAAGAPERTVGIHYLNPPLLMPLVEVVAGERTAPERLDQACALVAATGKTPIVVRRDVPGFAWNRLQLAIIRESVELVRQGVVSSEDADRIVRDGLARRWRHVGPLRTVALGGFETWNAIGRNVLPELSAAQELPDLSGLVPPSADPAAEVRRRDAGLIGDLREARDAGSPAPTPEAPLSRGFQQRTPEDSNL